MTGTTKNVGSVYTKQIPMDFIHKGTKFLVKGKDGQQFLVVAGMDGHIVSPNYGRMYEPDRKPIAPNYINVLVEPFADQYARQDKWDMRLNTGYRVNDTVYEDEHWTFWVTASDFARFERERDLFERQSTEDIEKRRLQMEADLAHAEADLARVRRELSRLPKVAKK